MAPLVVLVALALSYSLAGLQLAVVLAVTLHCASPIVVLAPMRWSGRITIEDYWRRGVPFMFGSIAVLVGPAIERAGSGFPQVAAIGLLLESSFAAIVIQLGMPEELAPKRIALVTALGFLVALIAGSDHLILTGLIFASYAGLGSIAMQRIGVTDPSSPTPSGIDEPSAQQ